MQLTDGDHVRGLLATYCRLVDGGDFAGIGALMTRARLCDEHGAVLATGAAEVERLYAGLVRLQPDGTPGTQHVVVNTAFGAPTDPADEGVRVTSTYVVLQAVDGLPLQPVVTGSYVDTFMQDGPGDVAGGWRFAERRFGIGLSGTLDHHLTIAV